MSVTPKDLYHSKVWKERQLIMSNFKRDVLGYWIIGICCAVVAVGCIVQIVRGGETATCETAVGANPLTDEIYKDDKGEWRWRLKARNNEIVAQGEGYKNRADCEHALDLIREWGSWPRGVEWNRPILYVGDDSTVLPNGNATQLDEVRFMLARQFTAAKTTGSSGCTAEYCAQFGWRAADEFVRVYKLKLAKEAPSGDKPKN